MLDCERWTLTHSLADDAAPAPGTARASSVAAGDVLPDGDAEADPEGETEADGTSAVWLTLADGDTAGGSLLEAEWLADDVPEGEGDGDGDFEGDGEGDGAGDFDGAVDFDGDGEVEGTPGAGRAWHAVSVAAVGWGAACALAARPRVRKPPLSSVAAATLTCAKRIRIACLR
jgi:hypothetical protein